ncbi:extracellular solute-binding family 3 domain protein [Brucella suis bv. 3 str. 686]|nr:extracellular solute-binding family 3 domain protein [Brucella suis bv. 3 str. 686]
MPGGGIVIFIGEVHLLLALVRDGHGGDEGIELAGLKCWNCAIPVLGHELALGFHLVTERAGNVNVEAR